ncbi:Uncharacterised protein [Salmonella enterica subsp. enterica serovar Bovismorbificans]|uniref:Uncharacterized protein n=1 Tax=Salmonella enterica subsp. enterica serovar Bovismorbificans TaxID=58097 RepID=A0A655DDG1_SALET|nr:Uncharacterised protein [Salmonella enterica subsp. enterica serovar Bovismorbificans]
MRVFTTENGVNFYDLFLKIERFKIVGDRQQIGFRRKFHRRMSPVAITERAKLTGLDKPLQSILQIAEISRRG